MAINKNLQLMFIFLFVGYCMIVYVRQSVSYAAPVIVQEEHLADSDLGMIVSSQQLGYTVIKFLGGALVDLVDPGLTFTVSLVLTGLTCAGFAAVSSVTYFVIFWFLCGMAQGPAWSACAVLLKQNFPSDQIGTWWSILSTSSNIAGTAGPFVSQAIVSTYSWRTSLLAAATCSTGLGLICFFFFTSVFNQTKKSGTKEKTALKKLPLGSLMNPLLMMLCLNYLLVALVRGACSDWGQLYLIKSKGQSLYAGSAFISSQEVGGVVGSILAGYISDLMVAKEKNNGRPRLTVISALAVLQTAALYVLLFHTDAQSPQMLINACSFFSGFGIYGIITLLGVASMETAPEELQGTAHSMATLGGNIGRVIAGYPLSVIATRTSWHQSFITVLLVSLASVVVSLVCVRLLDLRRKGTEAKTS